jgi:aminopeptidase N
MQFELTDSLAIDSITMNGILQIYSHTNNIIQINFTNSLVANAYDMVTIYYQGAPPSSGFGSFNNETHGPNNTPIMWTLSEPFGAKEWWPCKQDLNDKIDSIEIEVTTPIGYKVAANGLLISETIIGGNTTTRWQHKYPIATYLIGISITNYSIFNLQTNLTNGTLNVLNYVYPEDSTDAYNSINGMLNNLQFYDSLYAPYPFMNEKYGHAQFNWGGGIEHQTMSFVGNFSFELLAHELAHQWWGDKVTCGSWKDIWLNEGFATYSTGLCYERFSPDLYWKIWKKNQVDFITSSPDGSVYVTDTLNNERLFDARLTYSKAAMVLHMIRWKIGDAHFFDALRIYQNSPLLVHQYARTNDLKNIFEAESGQNLDEFFNDWFYGEGFPSYTITYSQDINDLVTFEVSQTQSHPSVSFFEMPIPIQFKNATHDTLLIFDHTFNNEIFTAQLNFKVDSLILDPDHWIVCTQNGLTGLHSVESNLLKAHVFPNPANANIQINIPANDFINYSQISIMDALGNNVNLKPQLKQLNSSSFLMNIYELKSGIYFITVMSNTQQYHLNFIKN